MSENTIHKSKVTLANQNKVTAANGEKAKTGKVRRPGHIVNGNQSFLILDAPTDDNIASYIQLLKKKNVSIVVRACEPTYSPQPIKDAGIRFMDIPFSDGEPPPQAVVDEWLVLLSREFNKNNKNKTATIGVHCVAGLGRAPILVAIALVESGKDGGEAIDIIRKARKGAFNSKQVDWISKYKRSSKACAPCAIC